MSRAHGRRLLKHHTRHLATLEPEPAEVWPAAHGLAIKLYRPATGRCTCCNRVADRLTRADRLCTSCADGWCDAHHAEASA